MIFKCPTELTNKQQMYCVYYIVYCLSYITYTFKPVCLCIFFLHLTLKSYKHVTLSQMLTVQHICNKQPIQSYFLQLLPLSAMCTGPVWHVPLQEQRREVSTDQLQRDWPILCQQTSDDERYWSVVSTRVWTAPTHCSHAHSLCLSLSPSHTHTHTQFHFNEWERNYLETASAVCVLCNPKLC